MSTVREDEFRGRIGRTVGESEPWWPELDVPPPGTPNVVVILLDDTGFAHFGSYGSEIDTPNIDRLASGGLRYVNFHTTALCSPTRAALLTGRNHHSVGMRARSNFNTGFPNMRGHMSRAAATVAEVLQERGVATFAVGKWHLAPMPHSSSAGPFTHWPLQRGFDRFYGFLQGETDQFHPELVEDNRFVDPPATAEDGYHLSEDLVDRAIGYLRETKSLVPEKPFFLYLAFGATHSPHQAPAEYLAKYRGRFDEGWDVVRQRVYERQLAMGIIPEGTRLAPRNPGVEAWADLTENERRFAARLQEAFAAFLDHTDAQIGRFVDFLESIGEKANTLVMLFSDNGASREGQATGVFDEFRFFNGIAEDVDACIARLDDIGGPHSHCNYPWGWAQVGNCPGRWYKSHVHGGGVRDPMIVHWPARIDGALAGGIRRQFHHVVDITPTVFDVLGVTPPPTLRGVPQMPHEGTSFAYSFMDADEPGRKRTQYFEMGGHRAIWHEGWKAVAGHRSGDSFDDDRWELFHLDEDFSECLDLASTRPDKLGEMIQRWWAEAGAHNVLPLDDRPLQKLFAGHHGAGTPRNRDRFEYYPPIGRISADVCPPMGARSHTITCDIERADVGDEGVLMAVGTANTGVVLYLQGNRLVYDHNEFGVHTEVRSEVDIPVGRCEVGAKVERGRTEKTVTLLVNGAPCGTSSWATQIRMISSIGMDLGRNPTGITSCYDAPFAFSGRLRRITIDVEPPRSRGAARAEEVVKQRLMAGID